MRILRTAAASAAVSLAALASLTGSAHGQSPSPPSEPSATPTQEGVLPSPESSAAPSGSAPSGSAPSAGAPAPAPAAPPAAPAAPASGVEDAVKRFLSGFSFGTYGRFIAGGDLTGRPGRDQDLVARGSRLDEGNYAELELRREDYWKATDSKTLVVATLAFSNPMFHYNGEFDAKIAVRNLYLESTDLGLKGLGVWAGSRMYRGDDIYLLDFWPLDNLNTLGGGATYQTPEGRTTIALHAGTNQPNNEFYRQMSDRPLPLNQLGATQVDILNRQKFIASARVQQIVPIGRAGGLKFVAYGEGHALPGGQREIEPKRYEDLPADNGFVLGAQVGGFTGERSTHLNLFFRYAHGLAAYGELGTPRSLAPNRTSGGAYEVLGALSGNAEFGPVAVMLAGYARSFRNGSADLDYADVDEGIVLARPHVFFGEWGGLAVEGSYQAQARGVTYQQDGAIKGPIVGSVGRFGVVPFLSPAGMGSYSRPQIRFIYALTVRDDGARRMYPEDDVQSLRELDHFFGFGVEWWLNTSWQYGSMLGVRR